MTPRRQYIIPANYPCGYGPRLFRLMPAWISKRMATKGGTWEDGEDAYLTAISEFLFQFIRRDFPFLDEKHVDNTFLRLANFAAVDIYEKSTYWVNSPVDKDRKRAFPLSLDAEVKFDDITLSLVDLLTSADSLLICEFYQSAEEAFVIGELRELCRVELPRFFGIDADTWNGAMDDFTTIEALCDAIGMARSTFYSRLSHMPKNFFKLFGQILDGDGYTNMHHTSKRKGDL